jgi:hypothetical protein
MCIRPLRATKQEFGRPKLDPEGDVFLPCGKCHECITLRASDWGLRTQHELGDHDSNCCLTLTYDNDHLPSILSPSDVKYEFQKFMKRLRERSKSKLLYLCSHEFGSRTGRLHHHCIIFGFSFPDLVYWKTTPKGTKLFTSRLLSSLWPLGWANVGEASASAGFYIASYALKGSSQTFIDDSGDDFDLNDTMSVSKRPAVGLNYLLRNHRNLVLTSGRLPRYYIKKLGELYTISPAKLLELSPSRISQLISLSDSLQIYEDTCDVSERTPQEILSKYEIFRSKLRHDGDFRKKIFTKSDNLFYSFFRESVHETFSLEDKNV